MKSIKYKNWEAVVKQDTRKKHRWTLFLDDKHFCSPNHGYDNPEAAEADAALLVDGLEALDKSDSHKALADNLKNDLEKRRQMHEKDERRWKAEITEKSNVIEHLRKGCRLSLAIVAILWVGSLAAVMLL